MAPNERQNGFVGSKATSEVMFNKIVILMGTFLGFAVLALMILINSELPEPYMDEIFHVQQTQTYCKGNFSYVCLEMCDMPWDEWVIIVCLHCSGTRR